jgi:hypothetical protein
MTMYIVLSAFTSSLILLATTKASVLFFMVRTLSTNKLESSALILSHPGLPEPS